MQITLNQFSSKNQSYPKYHSFKCVLYLSVSELGRYELLYLKIKLSGHLKASFGQFLIFCSFSRTYYTIEMCLVSLKHFDTCYLNDLFKDCFCIETLQAANNPSSIYSWFLKPLPVLHSRFPTKTTI